MLRECEYVESAVRVAWKNLELHVIPNAKVFHGDFLTIDIKNRKFDLILGLGFIKHFSKPEEIIRRKLSFSKDREYIVIRIPKYTGLNYHLVQIVDETLEHKILLAHDLMINYATVPENSRRLYMGCFDPEMIFKRLCASIGEITAQNRMGLRKTIFQEVFRRSHTTREKSCSVFCSPK